MRLASVVRRSARRRRPRCAIRVGGLETDRDLVGVAPHRQLELDRSLDAIRSRTSENLWQRGEVTRSRLEILVEHFHLCCLRVRSNEEIAAIRDACWHIGRERAGRRYEREQGSSDHLAHHDHTILLLHTLRAVAAKRDRGWCKPPATQGVVRFLHDVEKLLAVDFRGSLGARMPTIIRDGPLSNRGDFSQLEARRIEDLVAGYREKLMEAWHEFFGE